MDDGDCRAPPTLSAVARNAAVSRHAALIALMRFALALCLDEWALPLAAVLCHVAAVHAVFERRPELAAEATSLAILDSLHACGAHPVILEWATANLKPPEAIS